MIKKQQDAAFAGKLEVAQLDVCSSSLVFALFKPSEFSWVFNREH